jgi:hypothetical protein
METIPESERESTRVQLEMPPRSMERLRVLKDKTEAASYAEVFRNALRIYEFLVLETEKGNHLLIKDLDGSSRNIVVVGG